MTPEEEVLYRKRQRSRAIVTALILGAMVILFFFIAMARIQQGMTGG